MMILLALCQEVETAGEASAVRQKMTGILTAGIPLTLAAITAALLNQRVEMGHEETSEARSILGDHVM